jgi:hypothetical protein
MNKHIKEVESIELKDPKLVKLTGLNSRFSSLMRATNWDNDAYKAATSYIRTSGKNERERAIDALAQGIGADAAPAAPAAPSPAPGGPAAH